MVQECPPLPPPHILQSTLPFGLIGVHTDEQPKNKMPLSES